MVERKTIPTVPQLEVQLKEFFPKGWGTVEKPYLPKPELTSTEIFAQMIRLTTVGEKTWFQYTPDFSLRLDKTSHIAYYRQTDETAERSLNLTDLRSFNYIPMPDLKMVSILTDSSS